MTDYFNTLKSFINDEILPVTITKSEDIQEMIDMVSTMENHLSSVLYLHKTRKLFDMTYETRCKLFRECDRIQNKIIEGQKTQSNYSTDYCGKLYGNIKKFKEIY